MIEQDQREQRRERSRDYLAGDDEAAEALGTLLEAMERERGAADSARRKEPQQAALEALGALLKTTKITDLLSRRMLAAAGGGEPWSITSQGQADLGRIFSMKKARTQAGREGIRIATARLLLDVGSAIDPLIANISAAQTLIADAGHHGPLGDGDEAGVAFATETRQGVDRDAGADFAMRLLITTHAGYEFGGKDVMQNVVDIPRHRWGQAAAWVRRNKKRFGGKTFSPSVIQDWAQDKTMDKCGMSLAGVFEQARQDGAAHKATGRFDPKCGLH
ncbi:hypothetical protein [Bosea sp. NBC_00550]|uniref:hypothetical protein n=1 Tax=Bosea sp. NBC_00550 TaxID=2969621 RepID=UPI002232C1C0|nr:hypothetical protein [Bosea sp. NBC_00550]UZF93011.1 hypothetical protein NWE53_01995 [Bosea sp. NBC_00550]